MPTLTLPRPHLAQQRVIDEAKRFNAVDCGRRWGKSELGMDRLVNVALKGRHTAWYAPAYKQLAPVWRELQNRLHPITSDVSQQERHLELKGGGAIDMWSLDSPDSGRGRAYACVVLDEAALIPNLENAWQESIRPQLTDHRGSAWFLSTPKGTSNYFHTLFQRGQDPAQGDWASWQMPTSTNPYIHPDEIESARADLSDLAFAQEYLAQFVSWEGAVFRNILGCVGDAPEDMRAVAIGADWAGSTGRGDFTVFIAINTQGQVLGIDRFRGAEYAVQRGRLAAFWEKFASTAWIFAELNSLGSPIVEQLKADGLPVCGFTTTAASKAEIIQRLAMAFERGTIRIPNDPVLIGELQAFESRQSQSGFVRYSAPQGLHDDTVMALALAAAGLGIWEHRHDQQRQVIVLNPAGSYSISPI